MAKYTFAAALLALALGKSRSIFFDTVHNRAYLSLDIIHFSHLNCLLLPSALTYATHHNIQNMPISYNMLLQINDAIHSTT